MVVCPESYIFGACRDPKMLWSCRWTLRAESNLGGSDHSKPVLLGATDQGGMKILKPWKEAIQSKEDWDIVIIKNKKGENKNV